MGLESGTYISDLVPTNPLGTDLRRQGANHLRLIKTVLQNTFPGLARAVRFDRMESKSSAYSVVANDDYATILCDPTGGAFNLTLPATGGLFAGWRVKVMKAVDHANPIFVLPASGTINGFAKVRIDVPFMLFEFLWTGSIWIRVRGQGELRAGSLEDFYGGTIPTGYALAYGQAISRADYPELFAAWGTTHGVGDGSTTFNVPDMRGRAAFGRDNMSGSSADRITNAESGILGNIVGSVGGVQSIALTQAKLPNIQLTAAAAGAHRHFSLHNVTDIFVNTVDLSTSNSPIVSTSNMAGTLDYLLRGKSGSNEPTVGRTSEQAAHTHDVSLGGNNETHNNMPPAMIVEKMFRLC